MGYSQNDEKARIEFDLDIKRLLELSEYINLNGMESYDSIIDGYIQRIV